LQSAVSQIWNLLRSKWIGVASALLHPADCKSAIRQIENLRYEFGRHWRLVLLDG